MLPVVINARVLTGNMTGVQRYTSELLTRLGRSVDIIAPNHSLQGFAGHFWEQVILPRKRYGRLLFSPSNSGPLEVKHQVVTIHDTAVFDFPESFNPRFAAWYRFLLPKLAQRALKIITVSEFIKDRIVIHTKVSPDKVVVIPNGVDSRFCPEAASQADQMIAALKLPRSRYILAVGTLEPRKNLDRLFQAWRKIQNHLSQDIWLVVAGAGSSQVFNAVHFGNLPARTLLTGHIEDSLLPALYSGAIGMVYPSLYEGFGLPPLEAMASGTVVLVGNQSSMPEVVGDAGLLMNPFDVDSIAEGIYRIVLDVQLKQELRTKGLSRAKQFSWDDTMRRTWDVLQSVLANH
ncbi:MAG TPA: glycosyltransferase family 1 protein [Candidatus Acidoferrum sp.]|jgi:glycosyltransferase involved in cell wall biosynthesis